MAEEFLLSVFFSVGLCAGLPMVFWALLSLKHLKKGMSQISPFIFCLVYSDIIELVLSPFVKTRFLEEEPCHDSSPCWALYSLLAVARLFGLHFHQLVALEGILCLLYKTDSLSFLWSSVLSLIVWIIVATCYFFTFGYTINFIFSAVPVILPLLMIALTFRLVHKHPGLCLFAVAVFTLAVFYVPFLLLCYLNYPAPFYDSPWTTTAVSIMSLRLVTDPLLCVLVCRETLKSKVSQRHTTDREVQAGTD